MEVASLIIWISVIIQWIFSYSHLNSLLPNYIYLIISLLSILFIILINVSRIKVKYSGEILNNHYYYACLFIVFGIILLCSTTFLLGASLTLCSLITCNILLFIWQWRLFYSNENLFPFILFGISEILIGVSVIHFITYFTGPIIWQYVIEFKSIPGIQINHIFFLILLFYSIFHCITFIRSGLLIREKRKSTVFWDESISISPVEIGWVLIWAMGSISWCYSSPSFTYHSRSFLFSIQLSFIILYMNCINQRNGLHTGNLFHPILLYFLLPLLNNIFINMINDEYMSILTCFILFCYWIYHITFKSSKEAQKIPYKQKNTSIII